MRKKALAIVVGGGPAPGINGVISAATIEALNRGYRVFGVQDGFERLSRGDQGAFRELSFDDVLHITGDGGSILGTSRENAAASPEKLARIKKLLQDLGIAYLLTIGGDDTAASARAVADCNAEELAVAFVPKTVDNDLYLPLGHMCLGYQSARAAGVEVVETLMADARTTRRWYLVISLGRKAGHLALGIGSAAGATLTLIPEDFCNAPLHLTFLSNLLAGAVIKRLSSGRAYGVAVLAEGLAGAIDPQDLPELRSAVRDQYGNISFSHFNFGDVLKHALRRTLKDLGVEMIVVDKNIGYELRSRPPIPFDRQYARELGYGAVDFLVSGGRSGVVLPTSEGFQVLPLEKLFAPGQLRTKVKYVERSSLSYQVARKYMIRLTEADLSDRERLNAVSAQTNLGADLFRRHFQAVAASQEEYPEQL